MKKVGIITLHRTTNYGSVLQAYALQKTIARLGYKATIIDYRPERSTMKSMLIGLKNKSGILRKSFVARTIARIIIFPSYLLRFRAFNDFVDRELKLTKSHYSTEKDIEKNPPHFDIYCTGSDQVWNTDWNGKIDKPLYLSFAPDNARKISYAASFGKTELANWETEQTKQLLRRYESISVRETDGIRILKKLGIAKAQNVLDPTLLLDSKDWDKLSSNKYTNEKYILVYNLNRNPKIHNYAKELSRKTGLKIKYITYQLHDFYKTGRMYCNVSVEDYLALIKNASYVVTDSFHGVAFSINFNKNFIVIYPEKFSSRLKSILKLTELTDRVANGKFDEQMATSDIDYGKINGIIEEERNRSLDYLSSALRGNNEKGI